MAPFHAHSTSVEFQTIVLCGEWFDHRNPAVQLRRLWKSESDEIFKRWKILDEGNVFVSLYFLYLAY